MGAIRSSSGVPKTFRGFSWSKILDTLAGNAAAARGNMLFRSASEWKRLAIGAANYGFIAQGAGADPIWGAFSSVAGGQITKFKAADESRNSTTTLADDDTLFCTLQANKRYRLEFEIYFNASATPDFSYDLNFTGTTTSVYARAFHSVWTTASLPTGFNDTTHQTAAQIALNLRRNYTIAGTDTIPLSITVNIDVGASGGTFSFRWAQRLSDAANVTVRRNSNLIVTESS